MKDIKDLTPAKLIAKTKQSQDYAWKELFRKSIVDAVIRNEGNRNAAARELGINRLTVYKYMREYWASKPL